MTDNGLAALAAAMHKRLAIHGRYTPKCICNFDAAAILGERGVFLPDGLGRESCDPPCGDCCREHPHWSHVHSDQFGARPPTVRETLERLGLPQTTGRIPPEIVHPAPFADDNPYATIATLRAALDDQYRETPPCPFCGHREHRDDICEQDLGEHGECQCADTRPRSDLAAASDLLCKYIDQTAEQAATIATLRAALEDMVRQFAYWTESAGGIWTGGLSTLEDAFVVLGWDDPHPLPDRRCDEPGCMKDATCGWPTRPGGTGPNGGYRRTCGDHMRAALAAAREVTP